MKLITLASINLTIQAQVTVYNTNGSVANTLEPGNYIAEMNVGQQNGWYSIYKADPNFQKVGSAAKSANVFLSIAPSGQVFINA